MNDCYLSYRCNKYNNNQCTFPDFCVRLYKTDILFKEGLFSDTQKQHLILKLDSNKVDKEAFLQLKEIEKNIVPFIEAGKNLYIYSKNLGCGKTSWSLRLAQAYINKIWYISDLTCRILFVNVPNFFINLKDSIDNKQNEYIHQIKKYVNNCDAVIWDDIGTKLGTDYEKENLLSIIDTRVSNKKTNIYTSNLIPSTVEASLGGRLSSRIINLSQLIELKGADKRGFARNDSMSGT